MSGTSFPWVVSTDILRWVYIIEGIFSILIAFAVWFGLPTNPAEAYFLNEEEKAMMRTRYAQEKQYLGSEEFSWAEIRIAFTDPKLYLSGCIQFCQVYSSAYQLRHEKLTDSHQDILLYGFSTFLPAILKSSGYSSLQSNYLTIPVYVFGALCFYLVAFFSDRFTLRGPVSVALQDSLPFPS